MSTRKSRLTRMKFLREVVLEGSMLTKGMIVKPEEPKLASHKSVYVKKLGANKTAANVKKIERKNIYK